ncbi:MAG: bifunctional phosphopantothenoylcysteine decarboxylase/phosphopantothenate--cysteine ligase CoaBC [Nitrospiria bacterium]
MLSGKKILLGVTGSIAAYKAALILRRLMSEGVEVTVVMTEAAQRFVGPLTFESLSRRPVYHNLFDSREEIIHLSLARETDLILVAPATADFLARIAHGFADTLLSTILLSARCPIFLAPAMDAVMWENRMVQGNIRRLDEMGMRIIDPDEGPLASGAVGMGRLASEDRILSEITKFLSTSSDLKGEVILITAGPTQESLDPVRFISNRSSGKMGYALSKVARDRAARVVLISGPTALPLPHGVEFIRVETAEEMRRAVVKFFPEATILIMAAAVADWKPASPFPQKFKKTGQTLSVEFVPTVDILEEVKGLCRDQVMVGFSAETERLHENALKKLRQKGLDLIVANDITQAGAGFGSDTNIVSLIDVSGGIENLPKMTKEQVAERVLNRIAEIKKKRHSSSGRAHRPPP